MLEQWKVQPKRHGRMLVVALAVSLAGACAGNPPPVPISGSADDIARLVGEWSGQYWSDETGRAGSILFRLEPGADSAVGDVLMIPADGPPHNHAGGVHPVREFIDISFVRVRAGLVRGRLDPYTDPVCGCRLNTTFDGRLRGDTISGMFETRHMESGRVQQGEWRVQRSR